MLTTGVDTTLVGGAADDTYSAVVTATAGSATLTSGDQLNGGAGTDTLQITSTAAASLGAGVTSTGVENVTAIATGGTLTLALDGFSGVSAVSSNGSTSDVVVTGLAAIPTVNVTSTSANVTVTPAAAAVSGLNDSATINLTGSGVTASNTVAVNGVENITVNATGTSGSTAASGAITQTTISSDALLKALTIGGTGTAKLAVSLTGAGTGTTGTTATVTGSAGDDDLQLTIPASGKVTGTMGTGNDTLRLGTIASTTTISGGDGTDTLVYTGTSAVASTGSANITGFENVVITAGGSLAYATSNVTYTGAAAGTFTGLAAGGTVNANAGGTVTLANTALTGSTDAVTVNVGTATTAGTTNATVAAGTHDIVTINALTRSDTLATASATYTVSGATLNKVTVVAPHAVALAGGTAPTVLTNIDASGVAGNFSSTAVMSATANLTIAGGAGNDAITGGTLNDSLVGNAGADTITGGVGQDTMTGGDGADVFVFAANATGAVVSSATAPDTITDFTSGVDRIQVNQANTAFVGNVTNVQLGLAAMTAANQSFFVTSENTLYVVSGYANNAGVIASTDTIIRLPGVAALAVSGADVGVGGASGGADITLTAANTFAQTTGTTGGAAPTGANDTLRTTSLGFLENTDINGGNGVDTLEIVSITAASSLTALEADGIVGFETINIRETTVTGGTSATAQIQLDDVNIPSGVLTVNAGFLSTIAADITGVAINGTNSGTGRLNITGSTYALAGDTLVGGSFNDTISGGAGNDTITGGAGNDSLLGGDGDDTIVAEGTDIIDGGNGNDVVQVGAALGGSTSDLADIRLGAGVNRINFTATASTVNSTISATGGVYDILIEDGFTATMTPAQFAGAFAVGSVAGAAAESITFSTNGVINASSITNIAGITLSAGSGTPAGDNTLTIGAATTSVVGAAGNDTINVAGGLVAEALLEGTVTGNAGTADTVNVTGNTDMTVAAGGGGAITLAATVTGVEVITFANTSASVALTTDTANAGTSGTLTINATSMTSGVLTFDGSGETDGGRYVVNAGDGADSITGGSSNDTISGGVSTSDGADTITGLAGADSITGGAGADRIYGDNGGGTLEVGRSVITYATGTETDVVTVLGVAVTFTTGADLAASALAMTNAINAKAELQGLVLAVNDHANNAGRVNLNYLIPGDMPVAVDTTSPNNTNTMSTVTAGVAAASTAIGNDTIDGGAGADLIVGNGGIDVLTGGASADRFVFMKGHSALGSVATISDYRASAGLNAGAADTIMLLDVATAIGTVATVQDFSAQASFGAALNAAANSNTVNNGLIVFIWGGDTYALVETDANDETAYVAGDFVVKITGTPFTTATALNTIGFDGLGG